MLWLHKRYTLPVVFALTAVAATIVYRAHDGGKALAAPAPQAATVDVAVVQSRPVIDWHAYSGRLEAVDQVRIRPLVSGTITRVHFEDGSLVHEGDVLFTIDPRPYQAAVDQASARLAGAKASAAYTASELKRGKRLLQGNAIARRDVEQKRNAAKMAIAEEEAAKAALQAAQLDLLHTQVRAPISGRISRAEVTEGNVVQAGSAAPVLTTLVSVDRMYASFEVDEQSYLQFLSRARNMGGAAQGAVPRAGRAMKASVSNLPVYMGLGDGDGYPRKGYVAFVDNRLDPASGTIRVRAVFDNADGALLPGLYARIRLGSGEPRPAVLINEKAIGTDQDRRFVLVVGKDGKTAYRRVTLGASQDGARIILAGLDAGERIVVNGLQRVRPGDPVQSHLVMADGSPLPPQARAEQAVSSS
ncbi:efflux RND transporter periplasmic adaptor subunit [Allopusillimonas soli]|uniref:Efflux RND transporter periplasmic adaptor subunit n=1 Tax=Allopusillimonas soli TaxID=659016 RepID=A0A853FAL0_9BURK|nr:efflux RND transporter periplasmic adaptor subunit [Allopusillimonas soli]NYT36818.1 efflux RND transporter periplasmic adaptor subunit [Allopusillimonas soli]TEA75281.1 efflux RND transporter periplasmic adaptor subunit [Allopusillimonas soli]